MQSFDKPLTFHSDLEHAHQLLSAEETLLYLHDVQR